MPPFTPDSYGPVFAPLLAIDRARALDAGHPAPESPSALRALSVDHAFQHTDVTDRLMADACVSGTWLLHDFLDGSHEISQRVSTSEGSFWHGIMHRREGDYSNAKYWFRRVGDHPVFDDLCAAASRHAAKEDHALADQLTALTGWDPLLMVDLCETAVRRGGAEGDLLRAVQQAEWELLFDHCYRHAASD